VTPPGEPMGQHASPPGEDKDYDYYLAKYDREKTDNTYTKKLPPLSQVGVFVLRFLSSFAQLTVFTNLSRIGKSCNGSKAD